MTDDDYYYSYQKTENQNMNSTEDSVNSIIPDNNIYSDNNQYENIMGEKEEVKPVLTDYLVLICASSLIYIICAWISNSTFIDVLDIELPFLILFSLMIVYLSSQWSFYKTYTCFVLLAILLYFDLPQFSFILAIIMVCHLSIMSVYGIFNNEHDYS